MDRPIRILSLDGGGIRGIIPALVLAELERRTGRPIARQFDLIAGTSTGGILALGLARPGAGGAPHYSAADLVGLYEREGRVIFAAPFWRRIPVLGNLFSEKYPARNIEGVLQSYFGDTLLSEALTELIIPCYELENRTPWFFRRCRARTQPGWDFPLRTVARATSAAPTYFPAIALPAPPPGPDWALIDGGVFANNPALCAYVEARTLFPKARDFLVVSIGTGQASTPIHFSRAKHWGLGGWAKPMLDVVFDGITDTIDYQLDQLLPPLSDGTRPHYRLQAELRTVKETMDDAAPEHIAQLKGIADKIIADNDALLTTLATQLGRWSA